MNSATGGGGEVGGRGGGGQGWIADILRTGKLSHVNVS
jgi:hypothetical protein